MEKKKSIIKLGVKYLLRHKRRYYFLLAALIFCFAIITFITTTKDGMYDSVYYSAQSHYAGDIIAIAHDHNIPRTPHRMGQEEISSILRAANNSGINIKQTVYRTFAISTPALHHVGNSVDLRYLMGVDPENELQFSNLGEDGIIISKPVSERIKADVGDQIIIELDTCHGQKNTAEFIVKEIVDDTSIFGYFKAYISRITLNRLLLYGDDDASIVGFYLNNISKAEEERIKLQNALTPLVQTGAIVHNREEMVRERDRFWENNVIFLYTMPVYLSEISNILNAMNLLTYLLFIMMIIIILVSAGVTYNLILNERAKEMGVMRVIGFYGFDMHLILWTEIIIVAFISIIAGFILSCILSLIGSFISFEWFPGFEIFLKEGRLIPMYLGRTILSNILMLFIVIILLVFYHSNKIINKKLPELLSGEPL